MFVKNKVSKLNILSHTVEKAAQLLSEFPLTPRELQDVFPLGTQVATISTGTRILSHLKNEMQLIEFVNIGQESHADCIKYNMPIIPQPLKSSALFAERKALPTWSHRQEILEMISENKVSFYI